MDHAQLFDDQMIKLYPIIKSPDLLLNMTVLGLEPPLKLYTSEAAEDNACCFQELKHIVQGAEAKVYVDEFDVHLPLGGKYITLSSVLGQKIRLPPSWRKQSRISSKMGQSVDSLLAPTSNATRTLISPS